MLHELTLQLEQFMISYSQEQSHEFIWRCIMFLYRLNHSVISITVWLKSLRLVVVFCCPNKIDH